MTRVACFIDGFNLYHALDKLGWDRKTRSKTHKYKWLNLWSLMDRLLLAKSETLTSVHYFSAYAKWLPGPYQRHQAYVAALEASGVNVVLGHFKEKDRDCKACKTTWVAHEEKETDVNIALWVLNEAYKGNFDKALIVTRDSDMRPAIEMVRSEFSHIEVVVVAPPELGHSNDLLAVASDGRKLKRKQIESCLFPERVIDVQTGQVAAIRPMEYAP